MDGGLLQELLKIEAFKFGEYKLKSGVPSPVYFDLRVVVSYPHVLKEVAKAMWSKASINGDSKILLCGVPYTALPIASVISADENKPMLIKRKEAKDYGTKKLIEGRFKEGDECLIIEDVVTTGSSIIETALELRNHGLVVKRAVVLVDRNQGGKENLKKHDIVMESVFTLNDMINTLHQTGKISDGLKSEVEAFLNKNKSLPSTIKSPQFLTYEDKLQQCTHPTGKRLLKIILKKESNLCLAGDVDTSQELLEMAEKVGPHICMLKIHCDSFSDFNKENREKLKELSEKHEFLIMEDRKFGDIGNTVVKQLTSGPHGNIFDWADLVTVHALPGPGILTAIRNVSKGSGGCVIVAEMSSQDSLTDANYIKHCKEMIKQHVDCVVGFVSQSAVTEDSSFLHFTPGVRLEVGNDSMDQRYTTPDDVMSKGFCDVLIVGRGILNGDPSNCLGLTKKYQSECFDSYKRAIGAKNSS